MKMIETRETRETSKHTQVRYQKRGSAGGKTYCPACDAPIRLSNSHVGTWIDCPGCGAELEVLGTRPLKVAVDSGENEARDYGRKRNERVTRPDQLWMLE